MKSFENQLKFIVEYFLIQLSHSFEKFIIKLDSALIDILEIWLSKESFQIPKPTFNPGMLEKSHKPCKWICFNEGEHQCCNHNDSYGFALNGTKE